MNEREESMRLMAEVLGLCYEISVNSEADCFFNYSPHVNGLYVQVFEFGWEEGVKGEYYAFCSDVNRDNLLEVLDILYALKHKMGGSL